MKLSTRLATALFILVIGASIALGEDSRSIIEMTVSPAPYDGGRVYLPVRFGNMLGNMRLDTGAATTKIALAPWNKDFRILGQSHSVGASGTATACEDVEAKSVELKAAQGNNIARANYIVTRCPSGDDLLGLDFFRGARFSLDFERRTIEFVGGSQPANGSKPFQLLGPDRTLLGLELQAGSAKMFGLFDTGAELSAVDKLFFQKHKGLFTLVRKRGAMDAGGRQLQSNIYRMKELDLGEGRVLQGPYVIVYDFGPFRTTIGRQTPFVLGYNVLSRFSWMIDLRSKTAPIFEATLK
jgi:hypothetical protein